MDHREPNTPHPTHPTELRFKKFETTTPLPSFLPLSGRPRKLTAILSLPLFYDTPRHLAAAPPIPHIYAIFRLTPAARCGSSPPLVHAKLLWIPANRDSPSPPPTTATTTSPRQFATSPPPPSFNFRYFPAPYVNTCQTLPFPSFSPFSGSPRHLGSAVVHPF